MKVTPSIKLEHPIGRGAMGSVWLAHHSGLSTYVAVKLIAVDAAMKSPVVIERFKREAALAAKIKSPHVAQMLDHGMTADGMPYIVMELLEGETLAQRLKRERRLSVEDTALLVAQVAEVLGRAHELRVIHRDIKPSNVMLIESGYQIFAKVLDFGIAKAGQAAAVDGLTMTGEVMGSPLYMSPEQFADPKNVDGGADLWSFAVMTFEALTGAMCFEGTTLPQVMNAAISGKRRTIASLRPELSEGFEAFFAKALDPDPKRRFKDAASFAQAFALIAHVDPLAETTILHDDGNPPPAPANVEMAETVPLASAPLSNPSGTLSPTPMVSWLRPVLLVVALLVIAAAVYALAFE